LVEQSVDQGVVRVALSPSCRVPRGEAAPGSRHALDLADGAQRPAGHLFAVVLFNQPHVEVLGGGKATGFCFVACGRRRAEVGCEQHAGRLEACRRRLRLGQRISAVQRCRYGQVR
jgi:hypothetical protein